MSWNFLLAIFFVVWWIAFLAVLPWCVKSPTETGEALVPGQADGAPAHPMFRRKILITTAIALAVTGVAAANAHFGWIGFRDLPGPDRLY
jgi:predicted secreted protein